MCLYVYAGACTDILRIYRIGRSITLHISLKKMRTQFFLTGSVTPHFFYGSLGLVRDSDASSPKSLSVDKLNTFCCCCESRTSYRSFLEY